MLGGQHDRATVAGRQRRVLAALAAVPDRSHRMNDVASRQAITAGDLGLAGGTAAQSTAFGEQLRTGGAMDGTVDAATAEQRIVRCIDDGVHIERGDVGDDDVKPRRADLSGEPLQAGAPRVTPLSANIFCNSPAWNISRMISQPPTNSPLT